MSNEVTGLCRRVLLGERLGEALLWGSLQVTWGDIDAGEENLDPRGERRVCGKMMGFIVSTLEEQSRDLQTWSRLGPMECNRTRPYLTNYFPQDFTKNQDAKDFSEFYISPRLSLDGRARQAWPRRKGNRLGSRDPWEPVNLSGASRVRENPGGTTSSLTWPLVQV